MNKVTHRDFLIWWSGYFYNSQPSDVHTGTLETFLLKLKEVEKWEKELSRFEVRLQGMLTGVLIRVRDDSAGVESSCYSFWAALNKEVHEELERLNEQSERGRVAELEERLAQESYKRRELERSR